MASKPGPIVKALPVLRGRGTSANPANRFEKIEIEPDFEHVQGDDEYLERLARPQTTYLIDTSKTIIATNDSPDVAFSHSINPFRGCSHGCSYCYARPTHEYLGFSAGLDFETKVMVKLNAPALLRAELMARKYTPVRLAISGVTDCYQPAERKFQLTRQCLKVLAEFKNPVSVITKNHLITRDVDLLGEMAAWKGAVAIVSITTLDPDLTRVMEPQTSVPRRRLEAVRRLTEAGVPTGVMLAPMIPGLNDHEMPAILTAAAEAGARFAGYVPLRLPWTVAPIFEDWIQTHFPDRAGKVLGRVRDMRGGRLNDGNFGSRMHGQGVWAGQLKAMFMFARKQAGMEGAFPELSTDHFHRPGGQMAFW
jgi:DNA repair photolyase